MPIDLPIPLVTTQWLAAHLGRPGLVPLDASWYLPTAGRDPDAEFQAGHLPGAQRFDIDAASDRTSPLPHMLPTPTAFATYAGTLGIDADAAVVVYDGSGANLSAGRVWWMFRVFGHDRVAVLDGGIGKWRAEGRALETGAASAASPRTFVSHPVTSLVRNADAVARALADGAQVVDVRAAERFEGRAPEPRAGVRSGHMPGSRNVPYASLVDAAGVLRPAAQVQALLQSAGVDAAQPIICSCGSGVSAGALALALATLGRQDAAIYDGSWSEWGADPKRPVATGPA